MNGPGGVRGILALPAVSVSFGRMESLWDRLRSLVAPQRGEKVSEVVEALQVAQAGSQAALDARDRQIQWLSQRNAELTQQLVDAVRTHVVSAPAPMPTADVVSLDPAILTVIREKAGSRYERTELGRDLLLYATTAVQQHTPVEDIVQQIEEGDRAWT